MRIKIFKKKFKSAYIETYGRHKIEVLLPVIQLTTIHSYLDLLNGNKYKR